MSDKIQFACLGFGLCMFLVAAIPAVEDNDSQTDLYQTQIDLWSTDETEAGSQAASETREEVIQSTQDTFEPKSLPLDPQQVEPAPPAAIAVVPAKPAGFIMQGTRYELQSFVDAYYRRPWTYPGGIDAHLAEHGVTGVQGLSHADKEKLHAAIHERELKQKPLVKNTLLVQPQAYSNCPGGVCPSPQYTTQRRGLFGRRR